MRAMKAALPVLCVPLLVFAAGCGGGEGGPEVEFRVPVTVRDVGTGTVEDRIVATGNLRAAEVVSLRSETAGALRLSDNDAGRRLAEGDVVRAGQVVAEIRGEDVRLAARTEATRQRYLAAQRDYEEMRLLQDQGLISEQELRPYETAVTERKLEWEQSLLTEERSKLVTPISGIILKLGRDETGQPVAEGQLVPAGFTVAQVAPIATLIADVDVVGSDVARVRPGLEARVRYHGLEDRVFPGEARRLAPTLDPLTRALRVEVAVDNRDRLLRPGMFVEVTFVVERRDDVPVVPRDAVTERGGGKAVFVVKGQKVSQRSVVLGLGDDDVVEIREGLEPGERIVVKGLETLTDGARVRVSGA